MGAAVSSANVTSLSYCTTLSRAMLHLLWLQADLVSSSPLAASCSICDVPPASTLRFCSPFVSYSACRSGSTWQAMDQRATEQYHKLAKTTIGNSSCDTIVKQIQCMAVFNVCEMGTPETLCLESCNEAIEAACSLQNTTNILRTTCGSTEHPIVGILDDGKCFDTTYDAPEKVMWVIGFAIAVIFSFLASVGINLQKKALKQNNVMPKPVPAYRLPLWMLGFILCAVGSVLDFVAFGLAPQSLLAPLAALTLVWNMMLAPCFNKEKLSKKDIGSTLIIFVGATIAVVFASHSSPSYNLHMLMQLYRDPLTIVYFCIICLTIVAHYGAIKMVQAFALTSTRHRMIQVGSPAMWSTLCLVGYAGLAGMLGGQSVLFAKSTAELLKGVFHGDASCFVHYQTYFIALALIVCLCLQIKYLNGGLVHYDALSMVPVYQAYWVISGVLGGVIYFQEIHSFSVMQLVMFVLGISISIFGVILLSRRKHAPTKISTKSKLERGFSFTASEIKLEPVTSSDTRMTCVSEANASHREAIETSSSDASASRDLLSSILETFNEDSASEESDDDHRRRANEASEQANRLAIDNYLDMSTTVGLSEIFGALGYRRSDDNDLFLARHISNRQALCWLSLRRRARYSVDDIQVGLPAATREANPRESLPKRRSITFSHHSSADLDNEKDEGKSLV